MRNKMLLLLLLTQLACIAQESIYSIYSAPNKNLYAVGNGNVFTSPDTGKNWYYNHISDFQLYSICFTNPNTGYIVGRQGLLYTTIDKGATWVNSNLNISYNLYAIVFVNANNGFIVGANGLILKTTNSGKDWVEKQTQFQGKLYALSFINDSRSEERR